MHFYALMNYLWKSIPSAYKGRCSVYTRKVSRHWDFQGKHDVWLDFPPRQNVGSIQLENGNESNRHEPDNSIFCRALKAIAIEKSCHFSGNCNWGKVVVFVAKVSVKFLPSRMTPLSDHFIPLPEKSCFPFGWDKPPRQYRHSLT